jgi:hypothetical protein
MELTVNEHLVLQYMKRENFWISPTEIGQIVFDRPYSQASSRAAPYLKKLVDLGLIERSKGKYKIIEKPN